ncbi:hypothetical protein EV363DRAFT_1156164 [Boletus edulis]|nr:hypothetical protein EV363DRAFT_1156164 [Boletus edulis]
MLQASSKSSNTETGKTQKSLLTCMHPRPQREGAALDDVFESTHVRQSNRINASGRKSHSINRATRTRSRSITRLRLHLSSQPMQIYHLDNRPNVVTSKLHGQENTTVIGDRVSPMPHFDNAECVRLLQNKPGGLVHIMDDQACRSHKNDRPHDGGGIRQELG